MSPRIYGMGSLFFHCHNLLVFLLFAGSCGEADNKPRNPPPDDRTIEEVPALNLTHPLVPRDPSKVGVLVVDYGIDPNLPTFKDKIVAVFTQDCGQTGCTLKEGIHWKPTTRLTPYLNLKDIWNSYLRGDQKIPQADFEVLSTIAPIIGETAKNFHGSSTASVIAHNNPNVQFIFVHDSDMQLSWLDHKDTSLKPSHGECQYLRDIERSDWSNPKTLTDFVQGPLDDAESHYVDLVTRYAIDMVNFSFGPDPSRDLEKALVESCTLTRGNFAIRQLRDILYHRRAFIERTYLQNNAPLTLQSAGNHGLPIETPKDHSVCSAPKSRYFVVGSTDFNGARSSFSNYGECVDFYVLGEYVLGVTEQGFLFPMRGTSLSAPVAARLLSTSLPTRSIRQKGRDFIMSIIDRDKNVPVEHVPNDLIPNPNWTTLFSMAAKDEGLDYLLSKH